MIKIFSGSFRYCAKRLDELDREGWRIKAYKKWADGTYTYTMELVDESKRCYVVRH